MFCYAIIGFKKQRKLESVKLELSDIDEKSRSIPCRGKRPPCRFYKNMKGTRRFRSKHLDEVYKIKKGLFFKIRVDG